ncbi:MAG TPA: GNAT family N-acetyltransferase [Polyangiaceae bacterium]|nr:GNAT family N-acetyltransferase [Polyangiaceae bacterium]
MPSECDLEKTVVEAWPAGEQTPLEGWLLRASGGPTHRGNSVAALGLSGTTQLDARIARAERWYRDRQLDPMFQLGPCSQPRELDGALAARGYRKTGEAFLATVTATRVLERSAGGPRTQLGLSPRGDWLLVSGSASRFASTNDVLLGFLQRLGPRCRFVTAYDERAQPLAIGLGILSESRLGVYAMLTLPEHRRCGAARAVLRALGECAQAEGKDELYLLVEGTNAAARALYAGCGFEDRYAYHYRVLAAERERSSGPLPSGGHHV